MTCPRRFMRGVATVYVYIRTYTYILLYCAGAEPTCARAYAQVLCDDLYLLLRGKRSLNWGEPERAPHKRYSYARILYYILYIIYFYYGTSVTRNYIPSIAMNVNAKYSIAHSQLQIYTHACMY